jgi:hypothetical protein
VRIAYYALHYGKEYLAYSIRSVQDAVDEIHILYTAKPSFGHDTDAVNPDTLSELEREAARFAVKPIIWHHGNWTQEGQHRDTIIEIAKERGATVIATVDADELWDTATLARCLDWVECTPKSGAGRYRAGFVHFWRSLDYVCRDACTPERVIDVRLFPGEIDYLPKEIQTSPVYHFGYAQSEALMRYKWKIHGHQSDLRPGWIDRFAAWQPGDMDVHPTNERGFWNPEPVDTATRGVVDKILGDHPYHGIGLIK